MKPENLQPIQFLIAFLCGFGLAVIVFVLAAWSVERKPKVKSKKNYGKIVNLTLDLDEHERVMSE